MNRPLLSIITPAFNEASNLPELYRRLGNALSDFEWEWIAVDDHSQDETFGVLAGLAGADARVRGIRLSRNFGSHSAIACGLAQARGNGAVVLAADLQDQPELIPELVAQWQKGAQVVWAIRTGASKTGSLPDRMLSRLYYLAMRRVAGLREMPAQGADFLLLDRVVIDAIGQCREQQTSIFALLTWAGFRQEYVTYEKQPRVSGVSGWSVTKKIELLLDSIAAFSFAPLRFMSLLGVITALLGFAYAVVVVCNFFAGHSPVGWSSLMVVVLVVGGLQMLMLGVLGEYVWRALGETRRRPRFLIEQTTLAPDADQKS